MNQRLRNIHPDILIQIILIVLLVLLSLATFLLAVNGRIFMKADFGPWYIFPISMVFCGGGLLLYQLGSLAFHALYLGAPTHLRLFQILCLYGFILLVSLPPFPNLKVQLEEFHLALALFFAIGYPILNYRFYRKRYRSINNMEDILDEPLPPAK